MELTHPFYVLTHEDVSKHLKSISMEKYFNAESFEDIALGYAEQKIIVEATKAAYREKMAAEGITPEETDKCINAIYKIMAEANRVCRSCDKHCSGLIRMKSSPFLDSYFCEIYALECMTETRKLIDDITSETTPNYEKAALAPD